MNAPGQPDLLKFETFINDVLKADLAELERKLNAKNAEVAEFVQLKSMIATFQRNGLDKNGFKTQVDIGQSFFVEAHVPNASTILLNVGLGHYVEFTLDEALVIVNIRVKLLEKQIAHYRKEVARTNAHIKLLLLGMREIQGIKV